MQRRKSVEHELPMHLGVAEEDRGAGAVVKCCNGCVAQAVEEGARSMSELRGLGQCWDDEGGRARFEVADEPSEGGGM